MEVIEDKQPPQPDAATRDLIGRVASSGQLRKSPRLRELFVYLCQHTLSGEAGDLRESAIGAEVFGRPSGYDTGSDNVVRVSVFQLRKKLEQYFAAEGVSERSVILIPKGRYVVEFRHREEMVAPLAPAAVPPVSTDSTAQRRRRWIISGVAAGLVVALLLVVWFWPGGAVRPSRSYQSFWRGLFPPEREAYLVVADAGFGLLQDLSGKSLTLDQYLGQPGSTPDAVSGSQSNELERRLIGRQYTSVADASIAFRLGAINNLVGGRAVVRAARSINVRDLKAHNAVLLGSARSNAWVDLLKNQLDFQVDYEGQPPRGFIHNRNPRSGEPSTFRATAVGGRPGEAFGLLSYVPNLDGTGVILVVSGTNMEGTEAAAELVLNQDRFHSLIARLGPYTGSLLPFFEAVIRSTSVAGAGTSPEIVAIRRIHPRN